MYLPGSERDPFAEYQRAYSGRAFLILMMSATTAQIAAYGSPVGMSRMRAMGVGDGHQIVVYDGSDCFRAACVVVVQIDGPNGYCRA